MLPWCYVWLAVTGCNRGRSPEEPHAHFRLEASAASAFRTSDCEIPNCRAIRDGVIPALKAARTAFNFPLVNESGTSSNRRLRELSSKAGGFLPRRCCSAKAAATNWSSSGSVSRFIAFGRSLGRTCRTLGGLPGMMKVGLPATKSDIQPSRTGRVSLNSRDLCACSYLAAAIAGQQGLFRVRRILSRGVSFRVDVLCFRIRLSRISRSSIDLAPLKMRSSSADVCDRIRTKCRRVSH